MKAMQNTKIGSILSVACCVIFLSCNPVSKAIKTLDKNPEAAALYCANKFPVKDSIIKGDTVVRTDTVENILVDTVQVLCPPNGTDTIKIKATCPPSKTIYINTHTSDTIIRRDRAAEAVLSNSLTASQTLVTKVQGQYEDMKDKRDKWRLYFFILLGTCGVYVLLKMKRIIPFVLILFAVNASGQEEGHYIHIDKPFKILPAESKTFTLPSNTNLYVKSKKTLPRNGCNGVHRHYQLLPNQWVLLGFTRAELRTVNHWYRVHPDRYLLFIPGE